MKLRRAAWLGCLAAAALAAACNRHQRIINETVSPEVVDDASRIVGAQQATVKAFRDQQFDYIDQLRAAVDDATTRGEEDVTELLQRDLDDTLVATREDWRLLKRRLDVDLDLAAQMRGRKQ